MSAHRPTTDRWLDWLTRGRDADQAELRRRSLQLLLPIRDQVLAGAQLAIGQTVLDVGTGEGLLGISALEHIGPDGKVVFCDHSPDVLALARAAVAELGLEDHASFVVADAHDLEPIPDSSIDAVVLRSVLIYLSDRRRVLRTFARVLRPDGRLSLFEPLNAANVDRTGTSLFGYDTRTVSEQARAVQATFDARQSPDSDPMLTLTTPELLTDCEEAGFSQINAREELTSVPLSPADDTTIHGLLHGQPNPQLSSVADAARDALPAADAERFLAAVTDAARAGRGRRRQASLYLTARLPA